MHAGGKADRSGLPMLDIAIVGGGLCGLALAQRLAAGDADFALFEARDRLGGRILSRRCASTDIDIDLGPAWIWPDQPAINALCRALDLVLLPQKDDGSVVVLSEADGRPKRLDNERLHLGAQRIAGGTGELTRALAQRIPAERVRFSHALVALSDRGDHVELVFQTARTEVVITARRVVLAMPPRLVEEHILFSPQLTPDLMRAMLATPTWMAATAKAVMTYGDRPELRDRSGAGNAFVTHEQATLAEIFDASAADGRLALGGFLALPAKLRRAFRKGLPLLVANQFAQVFGAGFEEGELALQDWAEEARTCASQDVLEPLARDVSHRADPRLSAALWDGRVLLGGSETAADHAGYLEGALIAASRLEGQLQAGAIR